MNVEDEQQLVEWDQDPYLKTFGASKQNKNMRITYVFK